MTLSLRDIQHSEVVGAIESEKKMETVQTILGQSIVFNIDEWKVSITKTNQPREYFFYMTSGNENKSGWCYCDNINGAMQFVQGYIPKAVVKSESFT